MEKELFDWLALQAPVIVVLGMALWWMSRRLEKKEQKIEELQDYTRDKTFELLSTLKDTVRVLDKVAEGQADVRKDIHELSNILSARIDKFELDSLRNEKKKV
jgi:hypothetical protein